MEKYKFTYSYSVVVTADNESQAISKAGEILGSISELSLKIWLATHYKVEPVIESGGDMTDIN